MTRLYIVTGAAGHLGNTIVRDLCDTGERVRCFIMPNDTAPALTGLNVEIVYGDICKASELAPLFNETDKFETIVLHTAGIVSIATKFDQNMYDVNVLGTLNLIEHCQKHQVKRLIYISSVHAIPEQPERQIIRETTDFDPEAVVGFYAKTKAEATRYVLASATAGLDCVVIHPSGIGGPNDYGHGHFKQLVMDFLDGRLTAFINGGYDFVDVRDVSKGIIAAVDKGRTGECYILSNRFVSVSELLHLLAELSGKKRLKTILPLWFVRLTVPLAELWYQFKKQKPLYTRYSLYTLGSNSNFSHQKADTELGYTTRSLRETLLDTIVFLQQTNSLKRPK
ncbi:MAG: NAD-dependent epimerase/dehydratase family protein [Acetobacterium sp.]|uniref:NAD-dependent epimerase/dehydratase family protein n=1 Tax=Acetobacterium sp. TaxID=1872094 RepID=UPI0032427033